MKKDENNKQKKHWIDYALFVVQSLGIIFTLIIIFCNKQTIEEQQKYRIQSLRPWVGVSAIMFDSYDPQNHKMTFNYILKNYGNTPAIYANSLARINCNKDFINFSDDSFRIDSFNFFNAIYQNEALSATKNIQDKMVSLDMFIDTIYYFHVLINYEDDKSNRYKTKATYFMKYDNKKQQFEFYCERTLLSFEEK